MPKNCDESKNTSTVVTRGHRTLNATNIYYNFIVMEVVCYKMSVTHTSETPKEENRLKPKIASISIFINSAA